MHYTATTMKYSWIFTSSLIYGYNPFSCTNTYRYQPVLYKRCIRKSNIPTCCGYRCNLVRRSPINPGSCICWFSGPAGMKSVRNRHPVEKPLAAVNQAVPREEPQTVTTLGFKLLSYHVFITYSCHFFCLLLEFWICSGKQPESHIFYWLHLFVQLKATEWRTLFLNALPCLNIENLCNFFYYYLLCVAVCSVGLG